MKSMRIGEVRHKVRDVVRDALESQDMRTPEERRAAGEALREQVPLEDHARWEGFADREDPVALLKEQGATRIQSLLPLRYERMSASAFAFYRGAALIMANDLSHTPSTGIEAQVCGDAHIANFGFFSSPERRTVFDINDFDETSRGPWEWDIKRLAASIEICGRDRGFSKKERKAAVRSCVSAYREGMVEFASMGHLDVWYAHIDFDALVEDLSDILSEKELKKVKKDLAKIKGKDSTKAVSKLTEIVDGQLRIVSSPPTIIPLRDIVQETETPDMFGSVGIEGVIRLALTGYRRSLSPELRRLMEQYRGVDAAIKVVGVGSVGTRALMVVMEGAGHDDPLVLQVKEAGESVLERFCGKSPYSEHGERVVAGQRAMQGTSDILLGWCRFPDGDGKVQHYYVRQLWNGKGSPDLTTVSASRLMYLAFACGWTLAHAHARTGDRFEIAGYLGTSDAFDRALWKFARSYADQNEADYVRFMSAYEAGEL